MKRTKQNYKMGICEWPWLEVLAPVAVMWQYLTHVDDEQLKFFKLKVGLKYALKNIPRI